MHMMGGASQLVGGGGPTIYELCHKISDKEREQQQAADSSSHKSSSKQAEQRQHNTRQQRHSSKQREREKGRAREKERVFHRSAGHASDGSRRPNQSTKRYATESITFLVEENEMIKIHAKLW